MAARSLKDILTRIKSQKGKQQESECSPNPQEQKIESGIDKVAREWPHALIWIRAQVLVVIFLVSSFITRMRVVGIF